MFLSAKLMIKNNFYGIKILTFVLQYKKVSQMSVIHS